MSISVDVMLRSVTPVILLRRQGNSFRKMSMTVGEFESDENRNTRTMEWMSIRIMNLVNRRTFLYGSNQCHFTFWMLTYPHPFKRIYFLTLPIIRTGRCRSANAAAQGQKDQKEFGSVIDCRKSSSLASRAEIHVSTSTQTLLNRRTDHFREKEYIKA